jgi:histidine triad (HIT) family protein
VLQCVQNIVERRGSYEKRRDSAFNYSGLEGTGREVVLINHIENNKLPKDYKSQGHWKTTQRPVELSPEQKAAIEEQKQYCPFCKIVKGEIPASKVYEDKQFLAILDINPTTKGHILIIPKQHYPVLPFVPDKERDALARLVPQLGGALERAMLTRGTEFFIANGAAAGQQTSHFLLHAFPVDAERFSLQHAPTERGTTLKAALSARYASSKDKLTALLTANPELRTLLVEKPHEFETQLSTAPDIAALFAGVNVQQLAQQLQDAHTPRAAQMEDEALKQFLSRKEKLRELLTGDAQTLREAIASQPKLQRFFEGTTPEVVAARYQTLQGGTR